ncbi:hypothetical protein [Prescottella equi]|uniref:hypothetical protein n=1 Tax=Rhodococcus hoagii TaxID=43767 RepID=UPI00111C2535|nr:hypothetical protein [Prescottella equi]
MGRRSKQPVWGTVGVLTPRGRKELEELRQDPKRLESIVWRLQTRKVHGVADQSELDRLARLEALRQKVLHERKPRIPASGRNLIDATHDRTTTFSGARRSKKSKRGRAGALSKRDRKELKELHQDPQRLEQIVWRLQARKERGVADQSELDRLARLEALREPRLEAIRKRNEAARKSPTGAARPTPTAADIHFVSGGAPGLGRRR